MKWVFMSAMFILFSIALLSGDTRYGGGKDIVEAMYYSDVVSGNTTLKQLEKEIALNGKEYAEIRNRFELYNNKSTHYYRTALASLSSIKDTAVAALVRKRIDKSRNQYNMLAAEVNKLEQLLEAKKTSMDDYQLAVMITTTLPILENYQREELPGRDAYQELVRKMEQSASQLKAQIK